MMPRRPYDSNKGTLREGGGYVRRISCSGPNTTAYTRIVGEVLTNHYKIIK